MEQNPGAGEVLCFGETLGMFVPTVTTGQAESKFQLTAAGAESNVATYLSRLGHKTRWASRVGDDYIGRFIIDTLRGEGVGLDLVDVDPKAQTGLALKELGQMDNQTKVRYYRKGSAASNLDSVDHVKLMAHEPTNVHLSGITVALSDSSRAFMDRFVPYAAEKAQVSFDVNLRPQLWNVEPGPVLLDYISQCHLVFVGLDEAKALWGLSTPEAVYKRLPSVDILVVKEGPRGAVVFSDVEKVFVGSLDLSVVEPVGAGDAFAAGFIHGQIAGESLRDSARLGTILASASLSSNKDVGQMPTRQYIQHALQLSEEGWAHHGFQLKDSKT